MLSLFQVVLQSMLSLFQVVLHSVGYSPCCHCFRLCYSQWAYCTAYRRRGADNFSYKKLYLQLDEATVSFNGDPELVRFGACADTTGATWRHFLLWMFWKRWGCAALG